MAQEYKRLQISGYDPEANALNPRWDVNSSYTPKKTTRLSSQKPVEPVPLQNISACTNEVKYLPETYTSLISREKQFLQEQRQAKEAAR